MRLTTEDQQLLQDSLPFWRELTAAQREALTGAVTPRGYGQGESIPSGSEECAGLFLIKSGQLRVYMDSENGKEITLYRLFEGDICIFSASCMMKNINFTFFLQAEKALSVLLIPTRVYAELSRTSLPVSNYTIQLMTSRFSDVMWVMEQVLFMSFDRRLALFLIEQSNIEGSGDLAITHEIIARHMGSAREVVSRMLKYFQSEGLVGLHRGGVRILDSKKLARLAESR